MKPFDDWMQSRDFANRSWLILGKGPSFAELSSYQPHDHCTLGLNHVVRETKLDVAHAIDIEVIDHCGSAIEANADVLVMPWIPHVRQHRGIVGSETFFGPGSKTLEDYCRENPLLHRLAAEGRLLWYNLSTAPRPHLGRSIIHAKGFSASAAVNLLAENGVTRIRTLGVDGGSSYSPQFADLSRTTLLQTEHQSFDLQFEAIAQSITKRRLDFAPLGVEQPITVYVGTELEQTLAVRVLEYSIRRHTSMNVDVRALSTEIERAGIEIPTPRDAENAARTPFSFQRFAIPKLKRDRGKAIYLDSDMLVFGDLRQLWQWPMDGAQILAVHEPPASGRRPQFSVMVLDCESLCWRVEDLIRGLDTGRWHYAQLVGEMAAAERVASVLPPCWNDLERYEESSTCLTHFTDMDTQPWLSTDNLLAHLWCRALMDAVDSGYIDPRMVHEHIRLGWVRPSLAYQLEHRIVDPLLLPEAVRENDRRSFVPPHRKGRPPRGYRLRPLPNLVRRLYARSRHVFHESGTKELLRRVRRKVSRWRKS